VWRTALIALAIALAGYIALDFIFTDDKERVEAKVEHLLQLARDGGDDAVEEILDALADDYSGEYPKERIAGHLEYYVGRSQIATLTTGDYQPIVKGEEILIPIFRVDATTKSGGATQAILRVTFALRDEEWKIVNVGRWRLER